VKALALNAAVTVAVVALAPTAHAGMQVGNYEVQTPRDPGHSWLWAIRACNSGSGDCVHVQAIPRPNGQAAPWDSDARLVDGRYTMAVDVPDGVRCVVYFLPSHDTYSWDAVTLTGSVESVYEASCGGGPGGTATYPFTLVRY
jgi:hypothetical protein